MKVCLGANNIRFVFLLEVSQLVGLGAKTVYIFVTFSSCVAYSRFKILYSHKPMHYNGTEINTNIQYQYLHAHDKRMDVTQ